MTCRVLILAGTNEARKLVAGLVSTPGLEITVSLAGLVKDADSYPAVTRRGGFGGAEGLARYLKRNRMHLLVDATHPFATRITANAIAASAKAGIKLLRLERPAWTKQAGDNWLESSRMADLVAGFPPGATVLAPIGSNAFSYPVAAMISTRPDLRFVIRVMADPPAMPSAGNTECILAKPPFSVATELQTIADYSIDYLLCRNSGGNAGYAKIEAARRSGIPVHLLSRPEPDHRLPEGSLFTDIESAHSAIQAELSAVSDRL